VNFVRVFPVLTWRRAPQAFACHRECREQRRSWLNEDARYCGFSNPSTHSAHSEDDVVDEMLQLNEQIRFDSRAVGQTARVEVRPER
jgi:hypothetical protein